MPRPRRTRTHRLLRVPAAACLIALACHDSSPVTGPASGASAVRIAGTWSGSFQAYDSACGGSAASAVFEQSGAQVTGKLSTSTCGVSGYFEGTVQGGQLLGSIKMEGCTGGGVSGPVSASELTLAIGDLTKPLVAGDRPVMTGGAVVLRRSQAAEK